jgi:hypothetical protein
VNPKVSLGDTQKILVSTGRSHRYIDRNPGKFMEKIP